MKKNLHLMTAGLLASTMLFAACGSSQEIAETPAETVVTEESVETVETETTETIETIETSETEEVLPEGYTRSQLTNEMITEEQAKIRPIAVMCPNDTSALPQWGIGSASVIYQCRVEGTISRYCMLLENWEDLDRVGNIRSAREYFVYWAAEWDPVLFHYGNPYYADEILASEHIDRVNGTTATSGIYFRTSDRSAPQNAYISSEGIEYALKYYDLTAEHTDKYQEGHFTFAKNGGQTDLSEVNGAFDCTKLDMSDVFPVDKTYYEYNEEDGLYYKFQYGGKHIDAATGDQLAFSNLIIQNCDWQTLDAKGYLWFQTCEEGRGGYYITNGKAIPITWSKSDVESPTKYFDLDGNEIELSTGKTLISIVEDGECEPIFE